MIPKTKHEVKRCDHKMTLFHRSIFTAAKGFCIMPSVPEQFPKHQRARDANSPQGLRRFWYNIVGLVLFGSVIVARYQRTLGMPTKERLLSRIDIRDDGCWIWSGTRNHKGYGQIVIDRQSKVTHRVAYEEFVGPIPEGLLVCHHCDNPPCINPEHLFLGTHKDNKRDAMNKGRIGKLSPEKTSRIRELRKEGANVPELMAEYGVGRTTIYSVLDGTSWPTITHSHVYTQQSFC